MGRGRDTAGRYKPLARNRDSRAHTLAAEDWAPAAVSYSNKAAHMVVNDWLAAITQDRQPVCSGYAGMKALEMAMAVFAAGLAEGRVSFPLQNRQHPLAVGR